MVRCRLDFLKQTAHPFTITPSLVFCFHVSFLPCSFFATAQTARDFFPLSTRHFVETHTLRAGGWSGHQVCGAVRDQAMGTHCAGTRIPPFTPRAVVSVITIGGSWCSHFTCLLQSMHPHLFGRLVTMHHSPGKQQTTEHGLWEGISKRFYRIFPNQCLSITWFTMFRAGFAGTQRKAMQRTVA